MEFIKKNIWPIILIAFILSFFWQFFIRGLLPIPSDTIVGLYHPFLDLYAKVSPQGVPFQNFLITDPVRQIIPWKSLVIDSFANFQLPLWNPYEMAGKPLLANFQSSPFYPFNIILFLKPFEISWSIFIILQPILAGLFTFVYLRNLKLDPRACILGALTFAFCGFSIAWLEWGNVVSTALWLPLILFSIDKIFEEKKNVWWYVLFTASLVFSFFAGHLQVFFYLFLVSVAYYIFRWFAKHTHPTFGKIILSVLFFLFVTSIQWIPTFEFIFLSARSLDQNPLNAPGWFIPYQNLLQFLAPDFFGNPATLNYFGVWNYAEFVGYIGVVGLFLAFLSLAIKKQKEIYFFAGVVIVSLIFASPNPLSILPFTFSIPFISTSQPTRLIFLITFSLCILAAFGLDALINDKLNKKWIIGISVLFLVVISVMWLITLGKTNFDISSANLLVAKRNLILPTGILTVGIITILIYAFVKEELTREFLIIALIALAFFDLFRFGQKFTPFTNPSYFFPETKIIKFLQNQKGVFRIATTDSQILAPNIATYYHIQTIEGYDPLYLLSYAELIAASQRDDHSIKPPFGFNRIITPHNMDTPIINLLNVKYVLSLSDINSKQFKKIFQEGQTRVYENKDVLPRAFFIEETKAAGPFIDGIDAKDLFKINLSNTALVQRVAGSNILVNYSKGSAQVNSYSENLVRIKTSNTGEGFLVLTDSYYPSWHATIDGKRTQIYVTDINFRGIVVPKGSHVVEFKNSL